MMGSRVRVLVIPSNVSEVQSRQTSNDFVKLWISVACLASLILVPKACNVLPGD